MWNGRQQCLEEMQRGGLARYGVELSCVVEGGSVRRADNCRHTRWTHTLAEAAPQSPMERKVNSPSTPAGAAMAASTRHAAPRILLPAERLWGRRRARWFVDVDVVVG